MKENATKTNPIIGIVSLYDEEKESLWMLPGYVEGVEGAGAGAVILPLTEDGAVLSRYVQLCDGFLFPGGADVDPALYCQEKTERCGAPCPQRDSMEKLFFPLALETGKPILGICRGAQFINVMLGGTLYQDLPTEFPSGVTHHETPPYDKVAHMVAVAENTPLHRAVGAGEMAVNSYHHQGIKELGKGLKAAAYAPDGLVEAVCLPGHRFLLAVQWHPEFSHKTDENSRKIFRAFAEACNSLESLV